MDGSWILRLVVTALVIIIAIHSTQAPPVVHIISH